MRYKMTKRERMLTVLNGGTPDSVPFMPFAELIPRGEFERKLRERGMGLVVHYSSVSESRPNVTTSYHTEGNKIVTTYTTPAGNADIRHIVYGHGISNNGTVQSEFMVKDEADYKFAIAYINDTVFSANTEGFYKLEAELGSDGVIHTWAGEPPYMEAQYYLGLEKWAYDQVDYPDKFKALLDALDKMQEKRMILLAESPDNIINIGNLAGNFGTSQFEEYMLPYFKRYNKLLHEAGKKTTLHADAPNNKNYAALVKECNFDIIEAFTPPPVGNFSLKDAREAWGDKVTIWINFPESVFYEGYQNTKEYTVNLLKSDPCPNKIIGFTEMALMGVSQANRKMFEDGILAVMEAVEETGKY
jgi:hypothetical protein